MLQFIVQQYPQVTLDYLKEVIIWLKIVQTTS